MMSLPDSERYKKLFAKCDRIPEATLERAKTELGETNEICSICIRDLHDLIENQKLDITSYGRKIHDKFASQTDDYLMRFLRAKKFNVQKAYNLMKGYVRFREKHADVTALLSLDHLKQPLLNKFPGLLAHRDKHGRAVLLYSVEHWDPKTLTFEEVLAGYMLMMEELLENEETQINGFIMVENFHNYTLRQAFAVKPSQLKKMIDMLQGAFPGRFKGAHFIKQPWYFSWTLSLAKPFLGWKMASRLHVHGHDMSKFLELFDDDTLPKEHGGLGPDYNPVAMVTELENVILKRNSSSSKR